MIDGKPLTPGRLLGVIRKNPDRTCRELAALCGVDTWVVRGALLALKRDRSIKQEGETQGTRYRAA